MGNFIKIADGLDVGPALAELARQPDYCWLDLRGDEQRFILLLGADDARIYEAELPEVWRLIDALLAIVRTERDDHGVLCHWRVGLMPPGSGLPPHFDGIDGVTQRRYQLALASEPGVELIVNGELKCPRPGEAWQIDAMRTHSIVNNSAADRITIWFDTKVESQSSSTSC
jgi:hypothetical protein